MGVSFLGTPFFVYRRKIMAYSYPSDYLHYWWNHYSEGNSFLNSKYFLDKQVLLTRQLANAKQRRRRFIQKQSAASGVSVENFTKIYDYLDSNPDALNGSVLPTTSSPDSTPGSLSQAMATINSTNTWMSQLSKYSESLFKAAEKITDPSNFQAWGQAILDNYILNSVNAGSFSGGITNEMRNSAALKIINDFRSKRLNNEMFDVPDNLASEANSQAQKLDRSYKEILALTYSLSLASGSTAMQGSLQSSWGNVASSWKKQCVGLANYVERKVHETTSAVGLLNAVEAMSDLDDSLKETLSSKTIGGKNIKTNIYFKPSSTFQTLKQQANSKFYQRKMTSSGAEISINKNGVSVSMLRATTRKNITFTNPRDPVNSRGIADLTITRNGSFINFLNRELGMSGNNFQGLLQMLVGHTQPGDPDLSAKWNQLKENVAYAGFLSAVAGYSSADQRQYVIIQDKIVSVVDLVQAALDQDATPYTLYSPNYDRESFMSGSSWIGSNNPDTANALKRSEGAWTHVSGMLNSMLLTIKVSLTSNFILSRL